MSKRQSEIPVLHRYVNDYTHSHCHVGPATAGATCQNIAIRTPSAASRAHSQEKTMSTRRTDAVTRRTIKTPRGHHRETNAKEVRKIGSFFFFSLFSREIFRKRKCVRRAFLFLAAHSPRYKPPPAFPPHFVPFRR
jgi:hypothetical protein